MHCWWEGTVVQSLWQFLKNMAWNCPSESLLDIYLRDSNMYVHTESWTRIFMAAFFTRAKDRHIKCPSAPQWIEQCYIHAVDYRLVIRGNEVLM